MKDGRRCRAPLLKKGREESELVLSPYGRKGGSSKSMKRARKLKSCRGRGRFNSSADITEKMFEGRSL